MTARRMTANLPENLLESAMQVTRNGIAETLIEALEQIIQRRRFYERALALRGKLRLSIDLAETRGRRHR